MGLKLCTFSDAEVRLECRKRADGEVTYSIDSVTDKKGVYSLRVEGDHEEEICEVRAIKSTRSDCVDPMAGYEKARITLTKKNGLTSLARYANSLGFMKKEALPNCIEVLNELGFVPLDVWKINGTFAHINNYLKCVITLAIVALDWLYKNFYIMH